MSTLIRHVVLLVVDSLRADTAMETPRFIRAHAVEFTQARAAGCWTLPSHAAMFTGAFPHDTRCDRRSRTMTGDFPTLAEIFMDVGWRTRQVTANGVTTIPAWGLNRGFNTIHKAYEHMPPIGWFDKALLAASVPRLRKLIAGGNTIMLESEMTASKVWLRSTHRNLFAHALYLLDNDRKHDQRSFLYMNLMEAHFPYHVSDAFSCISPGMGKFQEALALYRLVSEDWLHHEKMTISPTMLNVLRERQKQAWGRLATELDNFVAELMNKGDTMVIICSDHGDAFGEGGEAYHVQAISDGCNRVPLWILAPELPPRFVHVPVTTKDLFATIGNCTGILDGGVNLLSDPTRSLPIYQAHYKADATPSRRHGQFAFVDKGLRYMWRKGVWHKATIGELNAPEPAWEPVQSSNLIEEAIGSATHRRMIGEHFRRFQAFEHI